MKRTAELPSLQSPEFDPVLGGALYKLNCRLKLSGTYLEFVKRRIISAIAITWLPLLLLSLFGEQAENVKVPFFYDFAVHVRFLVVLPIFIYGEIVVHSHLGYMMGLFTERKIITPEEIPKFNKAVDSAIKFRDSVWPEILLFLFVITVGAALWRKHSFGEVSTWYVSVDSGVKYFTAAGNWYNFISIPIFQFIYWRWGLRYLVYMVLLWRISRLNLQLIPTHPDEAGGIGFLSNTVYAASYLLFGQGALLAGFIANRIFFGGRTLLDFKIEIAILAGFAVLITLLPLVVFSIKLYDAKRKGRRYYGNLATRYVQEFEYKWIKGKAPADEPLIGSADIQSLADLYNSYEVVRKMRLAPFTLNVIPQIIISAIAPLAPLLLTIMPFEKIIQWVFESVF